jgi:protein SCO1/2
MTRPFAAVRGLPLGGLSWAARACLWAACACLWAACACLWGAPASAAAPFLLAQWPAAAPKPSFSLVDGDGHPRSLRDFEDRVSIVYFGFTRCPDVCPTELFKLAQVIRRLGKLASDVQVLFISLDPERDSPALVKAYVAAFDPAFIGLTGSTAQVNAAASSFSVQFAKVPADQGGYTIDHSTGAYAVDRSGRLRLVGTTSTPIDDWVHDLTILAGQ